MHGFRPGPYLITETPHLVHAIFGAMLFANIGFLGIGLVGARFFSYVTFVPKKIFMAISICVLFNWFVCL